MAHDVSVVIRNLVEEGQDRGWLFLCCKKFYGIALPFYYEEENRIGIMFN